jgi:hypothetical protein
MTPRNPKTDPRTGDQWELHGRRLTVCSTSTTAHGTLTAYTSVALATKAGSQKLHTLEFAKVVANAKLLKAVS